jgi:hypothetical protein
MSICQACQRAVATRRVTLMQNIGFVVARSSKTFTGELCRDCGVRMAKEYTLITFFFGWWGVISFILTPIFLIGNIVSWSQLSKLAPSDAPWSPPLEGSPVPAQQSLGQFGVADGGPFVAAAPAPQQNRRAEKTGNLSLLFSVLGIFLICVPLLPLAGIFFAVKAKRQSDEDGTAFPKAALAGTLLSALSLLVFTAFAGLYAWSLHEKSARLDALRVRADKARTIATLDKDSACVLAEELLVADGYLGRVTDKVTCGGELNAGAERAELLDVHVTFTDGTGATLTSCLRKGDRWFAAGNDACAAAVLPAKTAGLSADAQEDKWREAEKAAAAQDRVVKVERALDGVRKAIDDDDDAPLKECSQDVAIGRKIPHQAAKLADGPDRSVSSDDALTIATVELEALSGKLDKDWEFMSSKAAVTLLDKHAADASRAEAARELLAHRYLAVASGQIARELPVVPATTPGVRFDGGAYLGLLYLADLQTGEVLCAAPFQFESAETISVTTTYGHASDYTVRTEATKDFQKQYVTAVERTLNKALHELPTTAEAEVEDAPPPPKAEPKKTPPAKRTKKASPRAQKAPPRAKSR